MALAPALVASVFTLPPSPQRRGTITAAAAPSDGCGGSGKARTQPRPTPHAPSVTCARRASPPPLAWPGRLAWRGGAQTNRSPCRRSTRAALSAPPRRRASPRRLPKTPTGRMVTAASVGCHSSLPAGVLWRCRPTLVAYRSAVRWSRSVWCQHTTQGGLLDKPLIDDSRFSFCGGSPSRRDRPVQYVLTVRTWTWREAQDYGDAWRDVVGCHKLGRHKWRRQGPEQCRVHGAPQCAGVYSQFSYSSLQLHIMLLDYLWNSKKG